MKCRRCGRKLKTSESIEKGFGHTCFKKYETMKENGFRTLEDFDIHEKTKIRKNIKKEYNK